MQKLFIFLWLSILLSITACKNKTYQINFIVDDELYSIYETAGGEIIKLPSNPSKEDFLFDGWYYDNNVWQEELKNTSLVNFKLNSSITVYAKFIPDLEDVKYTITFETNGGSELGSLTLNPYDLIPSLSTIKEGYLFTGWYKDSALTTKWNHYTDVVTSDLTLYAGWVEDLSQKSYTVSFVTNGGSSVNEIKVTHGNQIDNIISEKENYLFTGWYKDSALTTKWNYYTDVVTSDLTLYAGWAEDLSKQMFKVSFETYSENKISAINVKNGSKLADNVVPIKEECLFLGWYKNENLDEKWDFDNDVVNDNITLHAKWISKAIANDTNVLVSGDMELKDLDLSLTVVSSQTTLNLDSLIAVSPYASYSISTDISGNNLVEENLSLTSGNNLYYLNVTSLTGLKKQYTLNVYRQHLYTVTYKQNNGLADIVFEVEEGNKLSAYTTVKTGYNFKYWCLNNREYSFSEPVTNNLVLEAIWEANTYKLSYEDMHVDVIYDSKFYINPLNKEGYEFLGWLLDGKLITNDNGDSLDLWQLVENKSITPKLEAITYTITFMATDEVVTFQNFSLDNLSIEEPSVPVKNGYCGEWEEYELGAYDLVVNALYNLETYTITYLNTEHIDIRDFVQEYTILSNTIELFTNINLTGYTFNGWFDQTGKRLTHIITGSYGDLVLTAKLDPDKYMIMLEAMNGIVANDAVNVYYNEAYKLPVPIKKGYTFIGWFDNTGSTGIRYTDSEGVSLNKYHLLDNLKLYAQYEESEFVISFDANGGTEVLDQLYQYGAKFDPLMAISQNGVKHFDGWYLVDGITKYDENTIITESVTLYAKWSDSIAISSFTELLDIKNNPSGNYHLVSDINCKGNIWEAIPSFSGVLDGGGFAIKNIIFSNTKTDIYGMIIDNHGVIENLTIKDFTYTVNFISTSAQLAILVVNNLNTIRNCRLEDGIATIKITTDMTDKFKQFYYGSIVGKNSGDVLNCQSFIDLDFNKNTYVDIYNDSKTYNDDVYLGGIVGYNFGKIKSCYNEAIYTLTTKSENQDYYPCKVCTYFGGVVGENLGDCEKSNARITVTNSSSVKYLSSVYERAYDYIRIGGFVGRNNGNIIESFAQITASVGGVNEPSIGGFAGVNVSPSGMIKSSYAIVDIKHNKGNGHIGGFTGLNTGVVQNSYARGSIESTTKANVAGFVGSNDDGGTINKCYAGCNVNATTSSSAYFVANSKGTLFKCYYLIASSLIINGQYVDYIVEYETINGMTYETLWSKEFLVDNLYWEDESWITLLNEDPILEWEIYDSHDYEKTVVEPTCVDVGYTIFNCRDCSRFFVREFIDALNHNYGSDEQVVEPNCTEAGYTYVTCLRCNDVHRYNYIDALGHSKGELIETVEALCETDGYNRYRCSECNQEFIEVIPMHNHTEEITIPFKSPICSTSSDGVVTEINGNTAQIECLVCHKVLVESAEILPHKYQVEVINPATCETDGWGIYTCLYENCGHSEEGIINRYHHEDVNHDYRCDRCNELYAYQGIDFVLINTPEDLQNINNNLSGLYRLAQNIDLKDFNFTGIGRKEKPFTGYFDGDGKVIKNLTINNQNAQGIFNYNEGVILNLCLENITGTMCQTNELIGGIAGYNNGLINNVIVQGVVMIDSIVSLTVTNNNTITKKSIHTFGAITGHNDVLGVISDSKISASFNFNVRNEIIVETNGSILALLNRWFKNEYQNIQTTTLGLVSGINYGEIQSVAINLPSDVIIKGKTAIDKSAWNIGHAKAIVYLYYGEYAGENKGYITTNDVTVTYYGSEIAKEKDDGTYFWRRESYLYCFLNGKEVTKY